GFVPVLPDAIETLVELGELAEAERLLRRLDAQANALEYEWALSVAARSRALLLLAGGETAAAVAEAERAAVAFEQQGIPVARARSLLVTGQALRRDGQRRKAAVSLALAAELFE